MLWSHSESRTKRVAYTREPVRMWAGRWSRLQGLCLLRQWMRYELSVKRRVDILVASVMASLPISQVTLSNHFTCLSLSFLICHGGSIPCPACLTDLSQIMGVCMLAQTTTRVETASRVIGLRSNLSVNLSFFSSASFYMLSSFSQAGIRVTSCSNLLESLQPHNQERERETCQL